MKRKAFKTSPSVRIPRAAVEKLQESKTQAQAQAQAQAQEIKALERAVAGATHDMAVFIAALRDLMRYFDKVNASKGEWTVADVRRIEEIRLLSLGI
jgi:hypothetical protein